MEPARKPLVWVAAALLLVSVVTSCGSGSKSGSSATATTQLGSTGGSKVGRGKSAKPLLPDLLLTQFPATSAEYNGNVTSAWGDFVGTIQRDIEADCIEQQGFTRAQAASIRGTSSGDVPPDNLDYPDLARLAKGQTGTALYVAAPGVQGATDSTSNPLVPASEQQAFKAAIGTCGNKALRPFIPVLNALTPLQTDWDTMIAQLPSDPTIIAATAKWKACMSTSGVPVTTPKDFFSTLDSMGMHESKSEFLPKLSELIKAYARCVTPLSKAMDRARIGYRQKLSDKYAPQIATIQSEMNALVVKLDKEYGVSYGHIS